MLMPSDASTRGGGLIVLDGGAAELGKTLLQRKKIGCSALVGITQWDDRS
jgi:hypothetical protein